MGAWGVGAFENDAALDWVAEVLLDTEGLEPVVEALRAAAPAQGSLLKRLLNRRRSTYLEAGEASVAVAAAELVAALRGEGSSSLPKDAAAFVKQHAGTASPELVALAKGAVERVGQDSELAELWAESDSAGQWQQELAKLARRLVQM